MGYYCPKADTDPEALKRNTPVERVAPMPPKAPEGVDLLAGADCPLQKDGSRTPCAENLCCGKSVNKEDARDNFDHCKDSEETAYEYADAGELYTFTCYEDGRRLLMTLAAVFVSVIAFI